MSRRFLLLAGALSLALSAFADPLSRKFDVDFFRDVPSRNLKGLATRSDGRLVAGPLLSEIVAPAPAELLWCLEPTSDATKFLVGTGPDGRVLEVTFNAANGAYGVSEIAKLGDPQVFALKQLPDGSILAGTSPKGALYLIREGKPVARALLPVDSIFDLLVIDANTVLASTGNPGRIYRIDVARFATVGLITDKITDTKILADRGITVFGDVRDRNVRRLAAMPDGRIVAGSAPRGNLYTFDAGGGAPVILQENRDAEVTDLLPQPNGDLYATVVFSTSAAESRITPVVARPATAAKEREREPGDTPPPPPVAVEKFGGRSSLLWFPAKGFAETLTTRGGAAFYRLARQGDLLIIAGGDAGELVGFDLKARLSITFPGSSSAQLNAIAPAGGGPGRYLLLRNNTPGFAVLDFNAAGPRAAETRRIDLSTPARLGALRFNRLRGIGANAVSVEVRVNNGMDEVEGWGPWTPMELQADGGWRAPDLRGRSAKLRIRLPSSTTASPTNAVENPELDRGALFALPQNRRPQLQEFRVLSPGYGLLVSPEQTPSPIVSLNQLLQGASHDDDKRKGGLMSSQVIPQPGAQVVLWTVNDPDGDTLSCTFSLRRDGDQAWTDVVTQSRESYAQFDSAHLPDGVYFTRLIVSEIAPRPVGERLSQTFETDDLIIDHTPPEIREASAKRNGDVVTITVHGRDQLSLLEGIEVTFSNNLHEAVEQPLDGVRDGRDETFVLDIPLARVSNATSAQVTLFDAAGNSTAKRLSWQSAATKQQETK